MGIGFCVAEMFRRAEFLVTEVIEDTGHSGIGPLVIQGEVEKSLKVIISVGEMGACLPGGTGNP